MSEHPPVLIAGFGPAGASVAIFLAQLGLKALVLDRKPKSGLRVGESLPPDAKSLLERLGVWEEFDAAPHEKCYGNQSYWFSDKAVYHDFMQHPVGHGWHLDRAAFDGMLRKKAAASGIEIDHRSNIGALEFDGASWRVELTRSGQAAETRSFSFIIDATGRNSGVVRKLGVERLYEDRQLALTAFLRSDSPFQDSFSLVETTGNGWWYSARIPGNRLVTAFFCKPDKERQTLWSTEEGWRELIAQAKHTFERMEPCGFELIEAPKFVSADSGILERVCGLGWLAVGDAAMTYDPIASHGLMMSMVSARDAAAAILAVLEGEQDALEEYGHRLCSAFQAYAELRRAFYGNRVKS